MQGYADCLTIRFACLHWTNKIIVAYSGYTQCAVENAENENLYKYIIFFIFKS